MDIQFQISIWIVYYFDLDVKFNSSKFQIKSKIVNLHQCQIFFKLLLLHQATTIGRPLIVTRYGFLFISRLEAFSINLFLRTKCFLVCFFYLVQCHLSSLSCCLKKKRGPIPCVYVIIWLLISIQASSSPLAKMFNPMDDGFVTACPLIFIDKQLSGLVFVSPLVLLRQAAWWPVHGADYRRQGHCWPEGPGNVGMAMGKGHHHSTVSIITVTQWWKSHRKQQADWRTFTHLVGFFWRIALQVHNILQIKKKKYC